MLDDACKSFISVCQTLHVLRLFLFCFVYSMFLSTEKAFPHQCGFHNAIISEIYGENFITDI